MEGFREPDLDYIDLHERLAALPDEATIKGMFVLQALENLRPEVARQVVGEQRFVPFHEYSLRIWLPLVLEIAKAAHPKLSVGRAIVELSRPTFAKFKESLIGRVVFAVVGLEASLQMTPRAYRRASVLARCEVAESEPGRAVLELRNCWDFPQWHIGTFIGGLEAFKKRGSVKMRSSSLSDFDLEITWKP